MDVILLLQMLGLGLATAITPCPLACNIATISYLSQTVGSPRRALLSSLIYTMGRILAYVMIGVIISSSLMSAPALSFWLQESLPLYLGPLFIITGLIILDYISPPSMGSGMSSERIKSLLGKSLYFGAFMIGFVLALAMCPTGAAIFFGQALPIALSSGAAQAWVAMSIYGLGTAIPVFGFALLIVFSLRHAQAIMRRMPTIQLWAQLITGWGFVALGLYWVCDNILFA